MKGLFSVVPLLLLSSCSTKEDRTHLSQVLTRLLTDVFSEQHWKQQTAPENMVDEATFDILDCKRNERPPDGKYRLDVAFAEWQGKSMGEKVTIEISETSIKVIYEGDGQLTLTKKGEIIERGILLKHKSGVWIIAKEPSDSQLEEVGGCTGTSVIDFKSKRYWIC